MSQTNSINSQIGFKRAPIALNLNMGQVRQPSLTNDTQVSCSVVMSWVGLLHNVIHLQISPDNFTWTTILIKADPTNFYTGSDRTEVMPIFGMVPAGYWYRIINLGNGTRAFLTLLRELTL